MSENKKIAKNAFILFVRMIFMTAISLYTSRVVLKALGVEDYGIYNIAGGIAVMFSFFSNAMYVSTQRFLTIQIGKGEVDKIKETFTTCINCHLAISLLVAVLSETIGLWFLNTHLIIPPDRLIASNWVFQFSLITCILEIVNAPYKACVIAYEKMSYFSWISIVNACCKLLIVYLIFIGNYDRLVFYSFILFLVSLLRFVIDRIYCNYRFKNCKYIKYWDVSNFKIIMSFSGWNLLKVGALIGVSQGNNILVNIFGGPIASAAMGIANQVNGAMYGLMQNIQAAFRPQITKKYAMDEFTSFYKLIIQASKFSSHLLFIVAIPFLINMEYVLELWLKSVPSHTTSLCYVVVILIYFDVLIGPLDTAIMAIGKIRNFQFISSILWIPAIPVAWLLLEQGRGIECVLVARIGSQIAVLVYSVIFLYKNRDFPITLFYKESVLKGLSIFFVGFFLVSFFTNLISNEKLLRLLVSIVLTCAILPVFIFILGVTRSERISIIAVIKRKIIK